MVDASQVAVRLPALVSFALERVAFTAQKFAWSVEEVDNQFQRSL